MPVTAVVRQKQMTDSWMQLYSPSQRVVNRLAALEFSEPILTVC